MLSGVHEVVEVVGAWDGEIVQGGGILACKTEK
jgi:hypothetical protein